MDTTRQRISSLDGLRAMSIIIVVVSHIFLSRGYEDKFYITGNLGVRIFFVISGFLIIRILINEIYKASAVNLKTFYFRRVLRIFPACYFYLAVIYFFTNLYPTNSTQNFSPAVFYATDYFFSQPTIQHTWSLAVEEQFYLVFPLILWLTNLKTFRKFIIAVILLTPLLRYFSADVTAAVGSYDQLKIAWNFHTNMDIIASGCLLALYENSLHENRFYKRFLQSPVLFSVSVASIICLAFFADYNIALFYLVGMTMMNLLIMISIDWLIVNPQSLLGIILNLRPVCLLGLLSYSIYLWQQPFSFYKEHLLWTHFPLNLFCILITSLISYYLIEKIFLDYRKNVEKKLFIKNTSETVHQG